MTAGGGFRHTQDQKQTDPRGYRFLGVLHGPDPHHPAADGRSRLRHFLLARRGVSHARWQEFWQLFPVVAVAVPVVLLLANQLNLLNVSDRHRPHAGVNLPKLRLIINILVLLLVGTCVQRGWPGGVYRSVDAASGSLLGRIRPAQGPADEHTDGRHADAEWRMFCPRAGLPRRITRGGRGGSDWCALLCLAGQGGVDENYASHFIALALAGFSLLSLQMGVIAVPAARPADRLAGRA